MAYDRRRKRDSGREVLFDLVADDVEEVQNLVRTE